MKLGSQKGVILVTQNEPNSKVSPMVYLHAGLKIGPAVPHAIHQEFEEDFHALGFQRYPCHLAWLQSKLGPQLPKWQNRPSRATVQGRKPWRSRRAKPRFTTLGIPSDPMPWDLACCHTGCLLFTKGMTTRMGQKAACGANGGIMDRTKS